MNSLHKYLYRSFNSAICKLFPEINVNSLNLRFYLTGNNTFDICTPIAKQLYTKRDQSPVNFLAQRICDSIEWNSFYIQSVKPENITNGFINLSISLQYLHNLLFCNHSACNGSGLSQKIYTNDILNKISRVVDHSVSSYPINRHIDFQDFSSLLKHNERKLLVLLAYLEIPDSMPGRLYTIKKVMIELEEYYSTTPIITKDREQSSVRIHLLQKVVEEITDHLH